MRISPLRRMRCSRAALGASALLVAIFAVGGSVLAAPARPLDESAVRSAMLLTYVHGVDESLAGEVLGEGAVPILRRLLAEPGFPRRDNVVAFLAQLDRGEGVPALLELMAAPPAPLAAPEEDRALLMAPQALGQIARHGGAAGLEALMRLTSPGGDAALLVRPPAGGLDAASLRADLLEMAFRGLALSGAPQARGRLEAIAQGSLVLDGRGRDLRASAREALGALDGLQASPRPGSPGAAAATGGGPAAATGAGATPTTAAPGNRRVHDGAPEAQAPAASATEERGSGAQPRAEADAEGAGVAAPGVAPAPGTQSVEFTDSQSRSHLSRLTWSNHPDVTSPMDAVRLRSVLTTAAIGAAREDYSEDVACCIGVEPQGSALTFGGHGDGLDIIGTDAELNAVLDDPTSRVHVVRAINWCGGTSFNIIGCAWVGGYGMAVVRMSSLSGEAILWIHEYGHNVGLGHHPDIRHIMYATNATSNFGLEQSECDQYHFPSSGSGTPPADTGVCSDNDHDKVMDNVDNCTAVSNFSQANTDGDSLGDACDACPADPLNDADSDLVCDSSDNCLYLANPDQVNHDGDRFGDPCDPCPYDFWNDRDGDLLCANVDNCPDVANAGQQDADADQIGDDCDHCPLDPTNDDPDGDFVCGPVDNCRLVANPSQSDWDLDTLGDACDPDREGDGVLNVADNCPDDLNSGQEDRDGDHIGDACDHLLTVDDNGPAQFATIQAAINAAFPGDIVLVRPGYYRENIVLKSDVDVLGTDPALTTIDGLASPGNSTVTIANVRGASGSAASP